MPGPATQSGRRVVRRGTSGGPRSPRDVASYTPTRAVVAPSRAPTRHAPARGGYTPAYGGAAASEDYDPLRPPAITSLMHALSDYTSPLDLLQAIPGAKERSREVLSDLPKWLRSNPTIDFQAPAPELPGGGHGDAFEQTRAGKRPHIGLTPSVTMALDDQSPRARAQAITTLIHEAVHAKQPPGVLGKIPLREGMAEILSRGVARQLYGLPAQPKQRGSTYQGYVNELDRRYAPNTRRTLRSMLSGGGGI